jgi:2-keto-4-pentenoate hydratase/2-oxohepta-3-ene-1,7-dioic acid hydratase in catechol pathway
MIGRFSYGGDIFWGEVKDDRVIVDRGTYFDTYSLSELKVLPPATPSKIICVGLNYVDHARELDMELPKNPILFLKPPSAVIGHEEKIIDPPSSSQVDFEAELAVVIAKKGRNISADRAEEMILGYTCFNDVTARDLQKQDGQWTRAKSFDTFAPLGPYVVKDIDAGSLDIRCRVNGRIRQESNTSNLIFDIRQLIEFISDIMTLERGDVIATGTPPGVGELFPGDVVEVEIDGIGVLRNKVVKN